MKLPKVGLYLGIAGILLSGIAWLVFDAFKENKDRAVFSRQVTQKEKVPRLMLTSLTGHMVPLLPKENQKPALINLWASWCEPCQREMPEIQKAYEQYGDKIEFRMVNLTVQDDVKQVRAFLKKGNYTFPVLFDKSGLAAEKFHVISIPQTILVDKKGEIFHTVAGSLSKEELYKSIQQLLRQTK